MTKEQGRRSQEVNLPLKEPAVQTPHRRTSCLNNSKLVNWCCFKHLSLWYKASFLVDTILASLVESNFSQPMEAWGGSSCLYEKVEPPSGWAAAQTQSVWALPPAHSQLTGWPTLASQLSRAWPQNEEAASEESH